MVTSLHKHVKLALSEVCIETKSTLTLLAHKDQDTTIRWTINVTSLPCSSLSTFVCLITCLLSGNLILLKGFQYIGKN